jgi:Amt family ammonium transporter
MVRLPFGFFCLLFVILFLPGLAGAEVATSDAAMDVALDSGSGISESAQEPGADLQENFDVLWILLCSALVFLMQGGFLCLESGLTRRKNSVNVAIKNLADFCLATVVFWTVGFGLMFGLTNSGLVGGSGFLPEFASRSFFEGSFFIFQVMFCGAAVTIMSGAVAERMHFISYLIVALLVSGFIYPVFGHWAWAGLDTGDTNGWLNSMGFVDFAGSTVVHSVGGWMALSVLIIIGPRRGRFSEDGTPNRIAPSNLTIATFGALLLFVGWLGFNGGSTLALSSQVVPILINTLLAASVGAISAAVLGYAVQNRLNVTQFINGCLGGLVAITANCYCVSAVSAVLIGLVGGMIVIGTEQLLEHYRIDDAVGAIPVHLGAGIWGTLAVGLYGDLEILGTGLGRVEQIEVQLLGVVSCGVWTVGVSYCVLRVVNRFLPLRVSAEQEDIGLNLAEHGEIEDHGLDHVGADSSGARSLGIEGRNKYEA